MGDVVAITTDKQLPLMYGGITLLTSTRSFHSLNESYTVLIPLSVNEIEVHIHTGWPIS